MSRFCGQASLTEVLLQKAFQHEVAQPTALAQKNLKHEAVWYYVETFYIHIYWHMQPPLHSILQQKYHLPRQFLGVSGSVYKGGAVSRSTICLLGWVSSLALIQKITENSMEHDEKTYADHWILNGKWWNAYETVENEWNMMRHINNFSEQRKNLFFVSDLFQYKNIQTSRFQCFVLCDQNKCHWMKHMIIFCHWHEMSRYVFIMANISTVYGCVVWYRCPLTTSNPSKQV